MRVSAHDGTAERGRARLALGFIALYAVLYLLPLAVRPLARPDEVRYGEIAREMIVSGDWVSPHFNGVRYFEKPVLGHWLNAVSFELLGENAFALRLPSALAALLTGLFVFVMTRRYAGAGAAMIASGVYLTTLEVLAVGTFAVLDTFLTLFVTVTVGTYFLALGASDARRRRWLFALSGVACGAAFLTKGFLALAVPFLVVATFLAVGRRWREILATPWITIAAAAVTAAPWAFLIYRREPDFWHYFFWVEHVQRFMGDKAQHGEPWWYYAANLPFAVFPWIFVSLTAIKGLRRRGSNPDFIRYLVIWAAVPFIFFSLSKGKLMTYVLPCLVPFAMLLGIGLQRILATDGRLSVKWPVAWIAGLLGLGAAALIVVQTGTVGEPVYAADEWPRYAAVLAALFAGAGCAIWAGRASSPGRQLILIGCCVLPVYFVLNFALPHSTIEERAPSEFLLSHAPSGSDAVLVSDETLFGTTSWTFRRSDVYVFGEGEIAYGMSYPEARYRSLDSAGVADLIRMNTNERDVIIFCEEATEGRIVSAIPPRATRVQSGELVLWRVPKQAGVDDG